MIYEKLFKQTRDKPINAGLIGTATYGISLLAQARFIPPVEIPVVCDRDPETFRQACLRAEISKENTTVCSNTDEILLAMEKGQGVIAENYEFSMDVPLYMAVGNHVKANVPAGSIMTCDMFEEPLDSILWDLRKQQDRVFNNE